MNKWLLFSIILINMGICLYAIAPNFVTFAEVYPKHIFYNISDELSVYNAITKANIDGLYAGVKLAGEGSFTQIIP